MIYMIDISGIQYPIDTGKIKAAGIDACYVKCSQYSGTEDWHFNEFIQQLEDAGITCGAYHFCSQQTDPVLQAEFFFRACGGYGSKPGQMPPMFDWEFCHGLDPAVCVGWLRMALQRATELWYPDNYKALLPAATEQDKYMVRYPAAYTFPNFAKQHQPALGNCKELAKYPLHFAAYSYTKDATGKYFKPVDGMTPDQLGATWAIPAPWTQATCWQYSGNGGERVPGIPGDVDRDVFIGSGADFDKFCGVYRPADVITDPVRT